MELHRFGVKIALEAPIKFTIEDIIQLFHKWVQNDSISDHLLIDVVDYSHIPDGPGVLLIAHEGTFSINFEDQEPGLLYIRKSPISGDFQERIDSVLKTALFARHLLENDSNLKDKIKFIENEFKFVSNDRLFGPNTDEFYSLISDEMSEYVEKQFPESEFTFERNSHNKERLKFTVRIDEGTDILRGNYLG